MLNLHQALKSFPPFSRQLICRGMLFTNYDCPQEEKWAQVYIEHSCILYVIHGRRIYHHQKHSWELKEGTCAFVKPAGFIAEKPRGEAWCVMVFFVPNDFLLQLIKDNQNAIASVNLPPPNDEPLMLLDVNEISHSCFVSMLPYFSQNPPPPENLIELKFKELILLLLVNPKNAALLSYLNDLSNHHRVSIHHIMHNNYNYNLRIVDYAKLCCQSVSTFKREFKRHFNETPSHWLMKQRLNKAKELLSNTSLPVNEVSMECGFENLSHFSRVFKEKTGSSPLRFRQVHHSALS